MPPGPVSVSRRHEGDASISASSASSFSLPISDGGSNGYLREYIIEPLCSAKSSDHFIHILATSNSECLQLKVAHHACLYQLCSRSQ
jgi:hypothetical protein